MHYVITDMFIKEIQVLERERVNNHEIEKAETLLKTLNDEQKKAFEKYIQMQSFNRFSELEKVYTLAFRKGFLLAQEIYEPNE